MCCLNYCSIPDENFEDHSAPPSPEEKDSGFFMLRKDSERRATLHRILTEDQDKVVRNLMESLAQVKAVIWRLHFPGVDFFFSWLCWLFAVALGLFFLVVVHGLSCPLACGILVTQPKIEPTSPALEGGVLATGPPEKSTWTCLRWCEDMKKFPPPDDKTNLPWGVGRIPNAETVF